MPASCRARVALMTFFGFGMGYFFKVLWDRLRLTKKLLPNNETAPNDEMMEVFFTNDRTEPRIQGVSYLDVSSVQDLDDNSPRNLARIVQLLNSAERTIDVAVYMFNVKVRLTSSQAASSREIQMSIFQALGKAMIDAHNRGVIVRILGCKTMCGASGNQYPEMTKAGESSCEKEFHS